MYLKQKDLFGSLDKDFVKEIMDLAETRPHEAGEMLFHEGDPADWLFILLKGRVKLSLGPTGRVVYVVSNAGEMFGWSSLVGRTSYSASGECMLPTKLLRFDRTRLEKIINDDAAASVNLFKTLAAILGERLIRSYAIDFASVGEEAYTSAGTGQVMDVTESELEA
jgi:CRP-like cAMP-binding protein